MSKPSTDQLLEKMLVMVPWVMSHDQGPTVEEVCQRFGLSASELESCLELLFVCGVYPFTPDTLMEAEIVDGRVWIRSADAFERPPFFRPEEALALVAAASVALGLPGNENNTDLESALGKLAEVLGLDGDEALAVTLAPAESGLLSQLHQAVKEHVLVDLDYYSNGRDSWSHRSVAPLQVFNRDGQWYLQAGSGDDPGDLRTFRVDRMRNVHITEHQFEPPATLSAPAVYNARPQDPVIVVDLESRASWVASQYPNNSTEVLDNGHLRVTLPISEKPWAERLLLRLGHQATVVDGDIDLGLSVNRILGRYGR